MPAVVRSRCPWSTTAEVAAAQRRLARWLHGQFGRKLRWEGCLDVAAEAIGTLDELLRACEPVRSPERLLRRIARHRALDAIRQQEGEAAGGPRRRPVALDTEAQGLQAPDPGFDAHTNAMALVQAHEDLAAALARLPQAERNALTLRHIDGLSRGTCAGLLGLSRPQYERLHTTAMNLLRAELADLGQRAGCEATRALVAREPLAPLIAARRDAHLAGCLPCTAYARARRERQLQPRGAGFCGTAPDAAPHAA